MIALALADAPAPLSPRDSGAFALEWARCLPWIKAALAADRDLCTLEDVGVLLASGEAQFWPEAECAAVTQLVPGPPRLVLNVWLCGGPRGSSLTDLRTVLLSRIETWARAQGCAAIVGAGRWEWGRALSRHGFAAVHTVFEKGL